MIYNERPKFGWEGKVSMGNKSAVALHSLELVIIKEKWKRTAVK